MNTTRKHHEETISILSREGVPLDVTQSLLRAGTTLHRLAELECSSEAADRDRVRCPVARMKTDPGTCLCRDYGNYDHSQPDYDGRAPRPVHFWRHGDVPRIAIQNSRIRVRVVKLAKAHGLTVEFSGDPRGSVLLVKVPSGRTNDWGQRGIVVA